ncbi:olfactory receptor 13C9-like [Dendropsophus ebraccatus]|uniref:olfactory receptor 13C9-like n=1 Tax=Dendropsophus ebraccatus TaxID=150705 RepID=UPI003831218A
MSSLVQLAPQPGLNTLPTPDTAHKYNARTKSPKLLQKLWAENLQSKYYDSHFGNQTLADELFFTAYPPSLGMEILLFISFLALYLLTMVGNGLLICTVILSPQLHTAMYFFLCNLALIDLFSSSNSIPNILFIVFSESRRISVAGCLTQMYFGLIVGGTECVLLGVMAYDRYIAISFPLHYTTIMSWRRCKYLMVIIWSANILVTITPSILKPFVFCRGNKVDHFTCESLVIRELVCGDIPFYKLTMFIGSVLFVFLPFILIVVSYLCIIVSMLKISSADGRSKAFSTCSSHLTVVFLHYGTNMTTYMGQGKNNLANIKYISIVYGAVIPVLNPFIYSLRNNDVKRAFRKMLTRCSVSDPL